MISMPRVKILWDRYHISIGLVPILTPDGKLSPAGSSE
jgi:hypothetical protein